MQVNDEVDKYLSTQFGRLEGLTLRSAGLVAGTALGATVVAARIQASQEPPWYVLGLLGVATISGVLVLLGTHLTTGPPPGTIQQWSRIHGSQLVELVETAKIIAATANEERLRLVAWGFYVQAGSVVLATGAALASAG